MAGKVLTFKNGWPGTVSRSIEKTQGTVLRVDTKQNMDWYGKELVGM